MAQADEISKWILHQTQLAGASGVVVDLDGGLDSAVAAALAQRSLNDRVLALIFSFASSMESVRNGSMVAQHLGLQVKQVDLKPTFDALLRSLPDGPPPSHRAVESRLRMLCLYHFASLLNYQVLGTSNRSDWEIGHFTKYGELAADLFPLLHLFKGELREIARELRLPAAVLDRDAAAPVRISPTGGPLPGFGYEALDAYLAGDLTRIPGEIQQLIELERDSAAPQKRPFAKFSLLNGSPSDPLLTDDPQIYDKSIEALTLISKAITSDQYLEDILRLIVMVTAEIMNSSVCSLWLLDEKEGVLRLRATQSIDREYLKDRVLKVGEGVVGQVVAENRPYIVPNVLTDTLFKEKDLARRMGLVSMLSIPMRVKDRVIGVINCYTSHPHAFSDLQMNILTTVANQAAVAIEKTELMVQTKVIQEELEKRKLIERAKDLLMKRFDLSGEEAYRWLQKRSMNTRKSMREVSEAVLLTMEG